MFVKLLRRKNKNNQVLIQLFTVSGLSPQPLTWRIGGPWVTLLVSTRFQLTALGATSNKNNNNRLCLTRVTHNSLRLTNPWPSPVALWLDLKCWFLWREENRRTWRKNPRSKGENQQQTQATYDAGSRNWTWDTLVGSERSLSRKMGVIVPLRG